MSASKSLVAKSFENNTHDTVINYCCKMTVNQNSLEEELQRETLEKADQSVMLGAPEVLSIGKYFLNLIGAKKVLDVGTFTGASCLAWALALPDEGKVYTLDITFEHFEKHGLPVISKCKKTQNKIIRVQGKAIESLDKFLDDGHEGSFDFAFIDADKVNYPDYYIRCVDLLRSGGVILVDNSLYKGEVTGKYDKNDKILKAIDDCNRAIFADQRTNSFLVNIGDGLHVIFKK